MSAKPNQGMVVGGEGPHPHRLRVLLTKRNAIVIGCILVLLLTAGGMYYYLGQEEQTAAVPSRRDTKAVNAPSVPLAPVDVAYAQLNDKDLTDQVNFLMGTKQYAEAERLISMQSDLATNKTKLSLLVTVQNAQGKKAEAAQTAAKIESAGSLRPGEYMLLGNQAAEAGDNQKAIGYYRQAIAVYNKEKQGSYLAEIERLEDRIKELQ